MERGTYVIYLRKAAAFILVAVCMSVVCLNVPGSHYDGLSGQWAWMWGCFVVFFVGMAALFFISPKGVVAGLSGVSESIFMLYGFIEACWGLSQIYGFTFSNHALYSLTGSFYNPGPYSGYLSMMLPVCVNEWLKHRKEGNSWRNFFPMIVMGMILCVLPAGMSRSAWIAAALSSLYVVCMQFRGTIADYLRHHRKKSYLYGGLLVIGLSVALAFIYSMKKESAQGRVFLWKTGIAAIGQDPWTGCGWNKVGAAYGYAQEEYFSKGDYTATEEHVAANPEYAFNEYIQVAVAWGVPALCLILIIVVLSVCSAHRRKLYGLCGAFISLMLFSFSSYPFQFPAFLSALTVLVITCGMCGLSIGNKIVKGVCLVVYMGVAIYSGYMCSGEQEKLQVCKKWMNSRIYYNSGTYALCVDEYSSLYNRMKWNSRFLFEYGHALHKLSRYKESNSVLEEGMKVSGDVMFLNIIGKNEYAMKDYGKAEYWLLRSVHRLPTRIYPYYLLAKLYSDSSYFDVAKFERAAGMVLTKEPKVQSTAVRQMREEVSKIRWNLNSHT